MDIRQIEDEALALPEPARAGLVWRLLQTLPAAGHEVSDEEVLQRDQDMANGVIEPISHEEFVRRVEANRG
jgi:hypothetical protein